MQKKTERQNSQQELQKLANQLRQSEMNVAGQKNEGLQKMQGNQPQNQGAQQGGQQAAQAPSDLQPLQMPQGQLPQPGDMQQGEMGNSTPVPGTLTPGQGKGDRMAYVPGTAKPGQGGRPMLSAPVPGTKPGGMAAQGVGEGPMSPGGKLGGTRAGIGTTKDATGKATKPQDTKFDTVVAAQGASKGPSALRAIEGQARPEQAVRAKRDVNLQNLKAEEEALDEKNLPASRRDQVKRYFNALREKLDH
jgi:hypothetical protein